MRILHFLGPIRLPLSPDADATGGVTRVALETARAQVALGHEVSVVALGSRRDETRWEGVRLVHLRAAPGARLLRFRWINAEAHVPLIAFTLTRAFDVVHVHEHWNVRFVRARVCILHVHNDPFGEPGTPRFTRKAHEFWARARRSTAQVGVSRFISRRLVSGLRMSERKAPETPHIRTVRNGVDHARFAPSRWRDVRDRLRASWAVDAEDVVFLYAGAVTPDKGAIHLARAFVERLRDEPTMRLVLAGGRALWRRDAADIADADGYEQAVGSALAPVSSLGRVQRLGVVPPDDLPGVYAASDVIVVPSIVEEAFGLVVLEAMAAGKPVIASRVGGIPEIVNRRSGILVPPGDVAALGDAMTRLTEDARLRRELATGAYATAQRFSWEDSARRLDRIYRWAKTASRSSRPENRRGSGTRTPSGLLARDSHLSTERAGAVGGVAESTAEFDGRS